MRSVKHVLLGSAAGICAVASAQAADLPVKAKPVEYVKVCSLYGAGFWYIPGTDTCIKVGTFTKEQISFGGAGSGAGIGLTNGGASGDPGGREDIIDTSQFGILARGSVSFDLRTQTDFGTLRQYLDVGSQFAASDAFGGNAAPSANGLFVDRAFMQFAGFTFGQMRSFFDIFFAGPYGMAQVRTSNDTAPAGIIGLAYTLQLGGGWSLSVSGEDSGATSNGRSLTTTNLNLATWGPPGTTISATPFQIGGVNPEVAGANFFDPVLNLRLDQAWGYIAASAALHSASGGNYTSYTPNCNMLAGGTVAITALSAAPGLAGATNGTAAPLANGGCGALQGTDVFGHPAQAYGYAFNAGFTLTNFLGMQGDSIGGQAVYSKGAVGYATKSGSSFLYGAGNSIGLGTVVDGIFENGSNVQLTQVISYSLGYEHFWTPKIRTGILGGEYFVNYDGAAVNMICNGPNGPTAPLGFTGAAYLQTVNTANTNSMFTGGVSNCNPNYSWAQAGVRLAYNPVPDLDIMFGFDWEHINTAFSGSAVLPASGGRPSGIYTIKNQDMLIGSFRVQRTFLY